MHPQSIPPGTWTHSHEEDRDGITVFRPASFSFPRSRGRMSFSLEPNGKGTFQPIGADDRHRAQSAQWELKFGRISDTPASPAPASPDALQPQSSNDTFLILTVNDRPVIQGHILKSASDLLWLRLSS